MLVKEQGIHNHVRRLRAHDLVHVHVQKWKDDDIHILTDEKTTNLKDDQ